jgi:hypothetical protein
MDRFSPRDSVIAIVVALFIARAVAAAALIPPWQAPDEPAHFVLASELTVAEPARAALRTELEREVLASMAQHDWWLLYQEPTPTPLPVTFGEVPQHLATGTLLQPAYYLVASSVLRLFPSRTVLGDYRVLSMLSLALSSAALLCGWAGTTLLLGPGAALGASAIVALHPQFLLTALTVGPDPLINLCGAFMWWQGVRLTRRGGWRWCLSAGLMLLAAAVAVFSKRNGIPLAGVAVLTIVVSLVVGAVGRGRAAAAIVVGGLVAACLGFYYLVANLGPLTGLPARLVTFWNTALIVRRPLSEATVSAVIGFLKYAVDSSWLIAGWLRFPAPHAWNAIAYAVTIGGLVGACLPGKGSSPGARLLWLPWLFVVIHVGTLLVVSYAVGAAPQGRYFFSVAAPMAALLWVGLTRWSPQGLRVHGALAIVAALAVLDLTAFAFVLMPAYL